jgi:hypothetical protein
MSPVRTAAAGGRRSSGLIPAAVLTVGATSLMVYLVPILQHWFVIPCLLCALLLLPDAVKWANGTLDLVSARGVLALFGLHFFFVAPIGHTLSDHWLPFVVPPEEWRDWLGAMALFNVLGLCIYTLVLRHFAGKRLTPTPRRVDRGRTAFLLAAFLAVCGGIQVWLMVRFGGLSGLVVAFETRDVVFEGTGWMLTLAENLPLILVLGYALLVRSATRASWGSLLALLAMVFMLKMASGGLRGSRSSVVFSLAVVVGMVHVWMRPITRRFIVASAIPAIAFLYVLGLYKAVGSEAVSAVFDANRRADIALRSGRTLNVALLGDLGRADVQAYLLYRYWTDPSDFPRAMGRTYVAAVLSVVPRAILSERPFGKLLYGTEALYGTGSFNPTTRSAGNVYGLSGELLLNFGPMAVPLGFAVLGYLVAKGDSFINGLDGDDPRRLLASGVALSTVVFLSSDIDNLILFLLTHVVMTTIVVCLGSRARSAARFGAPLLLRRPLLVPANDRHE